MIVEFKKGQIWSKTKNKLMIEFENETGKNAVYRGKITGQFEAWLYNKNNKKIPSHSFEIQLIEKPIEKDFDIFPAKFLKVNQKVQVAINKLFSYNVSFLNPEGKDTKGRNFNKIIKDTICPICKSIMHCTDCFKKKTLRVTFIRICHSCGVIFIFTCKYENKEEFKKKYDFFSEHIYKKRKLNYNEKKDEHILIDELNQD